MAKILLLAHRAPYPPDKGDKIRAFHVLRHLAERHEILLGACADDEADLNHAEQLKTWCTDVCIAPLRRPRRIWNMMAGALGGAPLSVARFRQPMLERWIDQVLDEARPDLIYVSSSAQAQYVVGRGVPLIVDFVDADAEKWRAYAQTSLPPSSWVYAMEARRVAAFERGVLREAAAGLLISETERRLLGEIAPESRAKLSVIPNGVDVDYFHPAATAPTPGVIVLCGRMDYRPNIDGARWFAQEILPKVRARCPEAVFRIVGAAPTQAVLALRDLPGVEVTGSVPDVRPHLADGAVIVAPLQIARGIQNKVLEAMAAGRPVVATPQALDGIEVEVGRDVLAGHDVDSFANAVADVLLGLAPADLGPRGRECVLRHHRWAAKLAPLDGLISRLAAGRSSEAPADQG